VHIANSLLHLQKAGNPHYIDWYKSYHCRTVAEKELEDLNLLMKKELENWLANVSSLRKRIYALNYFTCLQLLKISREFYRLINNNDCTINKEIFLLLMSLSPDLTIENVTEVMLSSKAQGIALKSLNVPLPSAQEDIVCTIGEVDVEIKKLSEEEKEIFTNVTSNYDYDPRLVLTAIHHHSCDEEAVVDWCMDNDKMFEAKPATGDPSVVELAKVKIDASNSTVKELVDMDFSEASAIEAVKMCGEDIEKCIDHCSTQQILVKSFSEPTNATPNEEIKIDMTSKDSTDSSLARYICVHVRMYVHMYVCTYVNV